MMQTHTEDKWTWELRLTHDNLSTLENNGVILHYYDKQDFNYFAAINLALITSKYLPYVHDVKVESNLLMLSVSEVPYSVITELGRALTINAYEGYSAIDVFSDIVQQESSRFSLREIDKENNLHITWFEGLRKAEVENPFEETGCVAFTFESSGTFELSVDEDTHIGEKLYTHPVLEDFSKIAEGGLSEEETVIKLQQSFSNSSIDTNSLAYSMSSLNKHMPDDVKDELFRSYLLEVDTYISQQQFRAIKENRTAGNYKGVVNIEKARKKKVKNRKKSKLLRKAKAKQRQKM
jgi:hypothetical protein